MVMVMPAAREGSATIAYHSAACHVGGTRSHPAAAEPTAGRSTTSNLTAPAHSCATSPSAAKTATHGGPATA
jgi:hypothetical protein